MTVLVRSTYHLLTLELEAGDVYRAERHGTHSTVQPNPDGAWELVHRPGDIRQQHIVAVGLADLAHVVAACETHSEWCRPAVAYTAATQEDWTAVARPTVERLR